LDSYQGQQHALLTLPATPTLLSNAPTTGLIAAIIPVEATTIQNFASRFENTFDECRILKAVIRIRPVSAFSGVTKFWFDEQSNATPTANEAMERYCMTQSSTSTMSKSSFQMVWTPHDLLDLQFNAIATNTVPVRLKIYTDNANFGSPVAGNPVWLIEPMLTIEFRGIKSA
jgi:hypothetical protein